MGEDRRTPEDRRSDELIAELRDRVRSLEKANRENRRIIASLTSRAPELPAAAEPGSTEPARRRIRSSSWWKEKFGVAMVGVVTAFAVLTANSGENPLRVGGGEQEQARASTTTQPAPAAPEPVPTEPTPEPEPVARELEPAPIDTTTEPVPTEPVAVEPAPEPIPTDPVRATEPVR